MKNLKVIFMGTPDFSVPILKQLINNTNVILVVTSPDALVGRKKILTQCPVKKLAIENNIEAFSPQRIRNEYNRIIELEPDIIITCAYGQIIPKEVLDIPKLGCFNIHASLLPKYRGGAPIQRAIMAGEKETGITLMYMDEGMDSGDIITSEKVLIEENDNWQTLSDKLSLLGSRMIIDNLPRIINKTNDRIKQNLNDVTFAPIIKREDELIDFSKKNEEVYDLIRALYPHPLAYTHINDMEYKIVKCQKVNVSGEIGKIIDISKDSFTICCSKGGILVNEIKPFGKNIMKVSDYFNGYKKENFSGSVAK